MTAVMGFSEIAQQLHISESQAMKLYESGMAKLKTHLPEQTRRDGLRLLQSVREYHEPAQVLI
jgi:hypothetical protein